MMVHALGSGETRLVSAQKLGLDFIVLDKIDFDSRINHVRTNFSEYRIDEELCQRGLSGIANCRKEWKTRRWSDTTRR
jgi:hypothetical protein